MLSKQIKEQIDQALVASAATQDRQAISDTLASAIEQAHLNGTLIEHEAYTPAPMPDAREMTRETLKHQLAHTVSEYSFDGGKTWYNQDEIILRGSKK